MSNISYIVYIDSGEIVQHGHCPEEALSIQGSQGRNVLEGEGDFDKFYVINKIITPYTDAELQSKNNLPEGFIWQMPQRIAVDKRALSDAQSQAWIRIKGVRTTKEAAPFVCVMEQHMMPIRRTSQEVFKWLSLQNLQVLLFL